MPAGLTRHPALNDTFVTVWSLTGRAPAIPPTVLPVRDRRAVPRSRWARWLGCDGNPLRRGTDPAETAIWLLGAVLMLTAVPAAGIAAGTWAEHLALRHARAQATALGRSQVTSDVFLAVSLVMLAAAFAVLGAGVLAHRALQRRRMRAWDAEWHAVAPLWTGPRT